MSLSVTDVAEALVREAYAVAYRELDERTAAAIRAYLAASTRRPLPIGQIWVDGRD